jgi:hypothetical protein
MEVENSIPNEINQTQKDKYLTFSHMYNLHLKPKWN